MGHYRIATSPEDDQAICAVAEMSGCSEEDVIERLITLMTRAYQEEMGNSWLRK